MSLKGLASKFKYDSTQLIQFRKADRLLKETLDCGECYFGPFVGEFGHLLSHIIPFLSYLKTHNIKINYQGPEIHKSLFYDDKDVLIINKYFELRDFYSEVSPDCNNQIFPDDVKDNVLDFKSIACDSKLPFWDISSRKFYWIGFCKWMYQRNYLHIYRRPSVKKENQVVIFARKKGVFSDVRGEDWDFQEVVDYILENTDMFIKVLGHPAYSHQITESERVEVILNNNNSIILNECNKSRFIINQLSGTHYLGVYANVDVILLLKGENVDYSNYLKDLNYRLRLNPKSTMYLCNSLGEMKKQLINNVL